MKKEFSQDAPVSHEALVATYSPEMIDARDAFVRELYDIKERAKAADVTGQISPRLAVNVSDGGVTTLTLGALPHNDFEGDFAVHRKDKLFGEMMLDLTGEELPGSVLMTATFNDQAYKDQAAAIAPGLELPDIKLEWGTKNGEEIIDNGLYFYADGYVESVIESKRITFVHPPDASELIKLAAQPRIPQEIQMQPRTLTPAGLEDIEQAVSQLSGTASRYSITL